MKKLIWSILTVMLVIGLAGGGAAAYFLDTETSTGNSFTAGTLDLKLTDINVMIQDGVSATWTMTNMAPGASETFPQFVMLSNSGSLAGNHVEIAFSNDIDEGIHVESETSSANTPAQMAQWLEITGMTYKSVNFFTTVGHILVNTNGTAFIDLDDLANPANASALDNLAVPNGGMTALFMDVKFNAGAGNDFQGDTLNTTVTFTLNQDTSQ
jgi:spore coat-associated protein N